MYICIVLDTDSNILILNPESALSDNSPIVIPGPKSSSNDRSIASRLSIHACNPFLKQVH